MTNPPPPSGSYPPPPGGAYPPPGGAYSSAGGGFPPQEGGYSPPESGGFSPPPQAENPYPPPPESGGYTPAAPAGGSYPAPSAAPGGYASPPAAFGSGKEGYTPWGTRVLAWLIDAAPVAILAGIGSIFLVAMQKVETVCITDSSQYQLGDFCATGNNGPSGLAWALFAVCEVIGLAFVLWNYGFKQGTTGSSIGKGILKFKVVGEATGQPVGIGMSIVRQLAHAIDGAICYIGYLFPLWDAKRQTIADKLVKTVCLPL